MLGDCLRKYVSSASGSLDNCDRCNAPSERVLGHEQQGVEGIYDRHRYRDEKADALARFATLIDGIVNPSRKQACLRRGFPLPVGRR
jgi:hypothetical protein